MRLVPRSAGGPAPGASSRPGAAPPLALAGGFSLLEILLVLVIVSCFLAPMTLQFTELRRQTYDAKNLVTATTIGIRLLEQIKGKFGLAFRTGTAPEKAIDLPAGLMAPLREGGTLFTPVQKSENLFTGGKCVGKKVVVTVSWNIPGVAAKGHSIFLEALVYADQQGLFPLFGGL